MPESHLRAADSDRTAVATVLGEHMAAGRLTVEEYEDRLSHAYAAKTYGDLDELTVDLPATVPAPRPEPRPAATTPGAGVAHGGWNADAHSWRAWLSTSMIVLTVWAVTSLASWEFAYFWPVWVIGPWGAVLLARTLTGGRRGGGGGENQGPRDHRRLG
jgi:hypothetical protein